MHLVLVSQPSCRFDRELLFPMPDLTARRSILAIHSRHWQPPPPPELLDDLAQRTGGYCGADLRVSGGVGWGGVHAVPTLLGYLVLACASMHDILCWKPAQARMLGD